MENCWPSIIIKINDKKYLKESFSDSDRKILTLINQKSNYETYIPGLLNIIKYCVAICKVI
jgi:hypothetical protein